MTRDDATEPGPDASVRLMRDWAAYAAGKAVGPSLCRLDGVRRAFRKRPQGAG